jgi:hypothetical protein
MLEREIETGGVWRMIQDFLTPEPLTDPNRKFNPYDRNLTNKITNKPVIGLLLSPLIGILQNELITTVVWWKIVFGMLFVLVAGISNWVFF